MTAGRHEIHPALMPVVAAAAERAVRMGTVAEVADGKILSATKDGVTLSVALVRDNSTWIVESARYQLSGASPDIKGLLEEFTAAVEGLPLQEAADHGTVHTLDRLRQTIAAPLVQGIHTPASMGMAFRRCDALIRDIAAQLRAANGDKATRNFWNPPVSRAWRANTAEEQLAVLNLIAKEFCAANGFASGSVAVTRIEKTKRILVDFSEGFDPAKKAGVLMSLERLVRARTGERLEVYMEELMDNNRIRRLAVEDVA